MQGPTHTDGGTAAALAGFIYLQKAGLVAASIHPLVGLLVMYPFAVWGSTAPDLDHSPGSVWDDLKPGKKTTGHTIPSKDIVSRTISHILHAGKPFRKHGGFLSVLDCRHRSWQTHSELPLVAVLLFLWSITNGSWGISPTDVSILTIISYGIGLGFLAHLILDLLTPEGLPFATGIFVNTVVRAKVLPEKIKIVPHVPPKKDSRTGKAVGVGFFSTGGTWEAIIFWVLRVVNFGLLLYIAYLFFYELI